VSDLGQQNMDAVRRFLAAVNRADPAGICAELDEQVRWRTPSIHGVTAARAFEGHAAVLQVWAEVTATTHGQLRVVLQNIEGDHGGVLAEGALSTPSGTTPIGYVMQMRDGKIRDAETFVNPGQAKLAWDRRAGAR
jgi:ketosteroid isomerase-like protein